MQPKQPVIQLTESLLSMKQAAKMLNVSYDTFLGIVHRKEIAYFIVGKRKKFYKHHLEGWLSYRIVKEGRDAPILRSIAPSASRLVAA